MNQTGRTSPLRACCALGNFERLAALLLVALGGAAAVYVMGGSLAFMGGWEVGLMGLGVLGAVVTVVSIWVGAVWPRIVVAVTLLGAGVALLAGWSAGAWPLSYSPFHDQRHVLMLLVLGGLTLVGLPLRWVWARWIGLALAVGTAVASGLNATTMIVYAPRTLSTAPATWIYLASALWGGTIWLSLAGPAMRSAFLRNSADRELWTSSHRLARTLRWAVLANLVALPMLLVYAWAQPVVSQTACSAVLLAGLLGISTALIAARKVFGAVLLVVGGIGLGAQALATMHLAAGCDSWVATYYAIFWLPAAVLSLAVGATLLGPLGRLLRSSR